MTEIYWAANPYPAMYTGLLPKPNGKFLKNLAKKFIKCLAKVFVSVTGFNLL